MPTLKKNNSNTPIFYSIVLNPSTDVVPVTEYLKRKKEKLVLNSNFFQTDMFYYQLQNKVFLKYFSNLSELKEFMSLDIFLLQFYFES